jgi:hypothetical protein
VLHLHCGFAFAVVPQCLLLCLPFSLSGGRHMQGQNGRRGTCRST